MGKKRELIPALLFAAMAVGVMITVFVFSGQEGETSSAASNSTGSFILELLHIEVPEGQSPSTVPIVFGFTVRNLAHIFLYTLLGFSLFFAAYFSMRYFGKGRRGAYYAIGIAFGLSLLYACLDEFHQLFIDGRSGKGLDIAIDALGFSLAIAVGFCCVTAASAIRRRRQKKLVCGEKK